MMKENYDKFHRFVPDIQKDPTLDFSNQQSWQVNTLFRISDGSCTSIQLFSLTIFFEHIECKLFQYFPNY